MILKDDEVAKFIREQVEQKRSKIASGDVFVHIDTFEIQAHEGIRIEINICAKVSLDKR